LVPGRKYGGEGFGVCGRTVMTKELGESSVRAVME
jgi:hypothetical protein